MLKKIINDTAKQSKSEMIKNVLVIVAIFFCKLVYAQEHTTTFEITGKVKSEKTISIADLDKFKIVELKDVNISCSPKKEDKAGIVKAVLLKDLLDTVTYDYQSRKELNEFYFVFEASDGYRILFSFNEIYNTQTGNNLFVVTELDGKKAGDMENGILILTTKDIKQGSRNMKWLKKIIVNKAE